MQSFVLMIPAMVQTCSLFPVMLDDAYSRTKGIRYRTWADHCAKTGPALQR